jgi:hypothetical protein
MPRRWKVNLQSTPGPDADISEDNGGVYSSDDAALDASWGRPERGAPAFDRDSTGSTAEALAAAENRIREERHIPQDGHSEEQRVWSQQPSVLSWHEHNAIRQPQASLPPHEQELANHGELEDASPTTTGTAIVATAQTRKSHSP